MDSSVLIQVFLNHWYFVLLIPLVTILRSSWLRVHLGKFTVNVSTSLFLDKDRFHLAKNATLPMEDGTTQTSYIITFHSRVLVEETKKVRSLVLAMTSSAIGLSWFIVIYTYFETFRNRILNA